MAENSSSYTGSTSSGSDKTTLDSGSSYTGDIGDAENDPVVDTSFFGDLFGNVDLSNIDFSKIVGGLGNLFSGTSSAGVGGQVAGLAGIAALLNKVSPQAGPQFSGYTGGVPTYTAERSQLPIPTTMPNPAYVPPAAGQTTTVPQTLPRRPGAGGITYFTPMTYKAAGGGISSLGDYSDGGRLLKGPGDGVSDSIPARIGKKQEARLADGEFVVPARIVSELGNGSTEAGARKLYAMMDRIKKARSKSMKNIAADSKAEKMLPA